MPTEKQRKKKKKKKKKKKNLTCQRDQLKRFRGAVFPGHERDLGHDDKDEKARQQRRV
jgi:hypothetical protein